MNRTQKAEFVAENVVRLERGRSRRPLKDCPKLLYRNGFQFRHIVITALSHKLNGRLPQGENTIRITSIISGSDFPATGAVIYHFLLIGQVTKIGSHDRTECGIRLTLSRHSGAERQ